MVSPIGDVSGGFEDDGVVWYEFMSELVSKINGYVFIETGGVIWVSLVFFLLSGIVNTAIN